MYGAILGDMVGAPYEFDRETRVMNLRCGTEESVSRTTLL